MIHGPIALALLVAIAVWVAYAGHKSLSPDNIENKANIVWFKK